MCRRNSLFHKYTNPKYYQYRTHVQYILQTKTISVPTLQFYDSHETKVTFFPIFKSLSNGHSFPSINRQSTILASLSNKSFISQTSNQSLLSSCYYVHDHIDTVMINPLVHLPTFHVCLILERMLIRFQ